MMDRCWIIRKNALDVSNIVYATLADDEYDAVKRFKENRNDEEWLEIIKNSSKYCVDELYGPSYSLANLIREQGVNNEELAST